MISSEERRQRWVNFVTAMCVLIFSIAAGLIAAKYPKVNLWWVLPTLVVICVVGIWIGFPRISKLQAALALACAFIIHITPEILHFPPLLFVAEIAIELVLNICFGAYWVRRGYIPAEANE